VNVDHDAPSRVDVATPDIARWAKGNCGIPYVWRFDGPVAGPRVTIQGLTHGNEVCGAIALDRVLREGIRPVRGTLSIVFANVDAYSRFDSARPFASRCVDEDFNRLWTPEVLDSQKDDDAWAYEFKWDGIRALTTAHAGCLLIARDGGRPAYVVRVAPVTAGRRTAGPGDAGAGWSGGYSTIVGRRAGSGCAAIYGLRHR